MTARLLAFAFLFSVSTASAQDWAKAKLEKSPRHGEWVKLKQGERTVEAFVVFPESKEKATAVVVIHEIFGLADWVKLMADELAEAGYIAIAPDLLSGAGPKGGGTAEMERGAIGKAIRDLKNEQITADLNAAVEHVAKLPACNGKVAVTGFCWGGGKTFMFATKNKAIKAALPFYGSTELTADDVKNIECPIHGFFAENDARVNTTVDKIAEQMKEAKKKFEPVTYKGGGHGFMRQGDDPTGSEGNKKAREEAWKRLKEILKGV